MLVFSSIYFTSLSTHITHLPVAALIAYLSTQTLKFDFSTIFKGFFQG